MTDYRDKFYSKYVSAHVSRLYGEANLDGIKKQFPVWQKYFGRFLPKDKFAKIIDFGCGNGGLVHWLQELGYKSAEGIDISIEQVEMARKLGIKNIRQADIKEFLNNSITNKSITKYDVIFMRDVIEHFSKEEILDVLELIYQSLKNGGIFITQTVNAENLLWGRLRHGDFTHELAFTANSLSQLFRVSGFNQIKIYPQRPVAHGLKSFIRLITWSILEFLLEFYLLIETGSSEGIFTQNLIAVAKK